jgi:hypothetical protein
VAHGSAATGHPAGALPGRGPGSLIAMVDCAADADDFVGQLFSRLEDDGESIAIRYGALTDGSPRWYERSHARFDGVGGLVHTIEAMDGRILGEPRMANVSWPSRPLHVAAGLTILWGADGARWRRLPRGGAAQLAVHSQRPAHAWALLGRDRVAAMQASRNTVGATVSGYLLSCLNAALAPAVSHKDGPALWVVPVNLRGAISRRRALSNHISFLPVRVRIDDEPADVTAAIRARLDDGSHWVLYAAARLAATGGARLSVTPWADRLRGRSVGLFSNLGAWQVAGWDTDTSWVCCPPVTRFLPLSAGVVTVNGVLGLTLQAYPSLTMRDDDVREWLQAWLEHIDRRIDAPPYRILRRVPRNTYHT